MIMVRIAPLAALIILLMTSTSSSAAANFPIAKRGCLDTCGQVQIPYPFGIGKGCYLDERFKIDCPSSSSEAGYIQPYITKITSNLIVSHISLEGYLGSFKYVSKNCYNESGPIESPSDLTLTLAKHTINSTANILVVIGCDDFGTFSGSNTKGDRPYLLGCSAFCRSPGEIINGTCDGVGCCQIQIPSGQSSLRTTLASAGNHTALLKENPCGYAFVIEKAQFHFTSANLTNLTYALQSVDQLPVVLDWVVESYTCADAIQNASTYACKWNNTICQNHPENLGYRCACSPGFEGNQYLNDCTDIDECLSGDRCGSEGVCHNTDGGYTCTCNKGYTYDGNGCILIQKNGEDKKNGDTSKYYKIVTGTLAGVVVILLVIILLYTEKRKRRLQQLREKCFRDNGGILLQQQLSTHESRHSTKIFSIFELERAADNFDESRIIGEGGFGTVYKGYLADNSVVAIKKSKAIDQNQIQSFINEVLVLSQINHRNVVKLLGCCLETEIPFLVYEFVENGTLFEHIHDIEKSSRLMFQMRLKIAAETAGVLSYLHSAASPPIIHRDIKSANILLDQNYTAKVADFGISRINLSDQAEISTMVQGTIGYLDPEYMQTSQLTEKSDVYSFGVLLIELFTAKRVFSFDRAEEERSLANYFLFMLKTGSLGEILDCTISNEGTEKLLDEIAILAKRCISINGEDRPTMKEVAMKLEGLMSAENINVQFEPDGEEVEPLLSMEGSSSYKFDVNSINTSSSIGGITDLFPVKNVGGR